MTLIKVTFGRPALQTTSGPFAELANQRSVAQTAHATRMPSDLGAPVAS